MDINTHTQRLLQNIKVDCIVPIPLSRMRMLQRGFNQAHIIATSVGKALGKPVITNILNRKTGRVQANLKRNQRLTKQRGTFMIRRAHLIRGKHLLIVDDIYTTGSTVNECARILKKHGARAVNVFTLARTI
ncbi:MAG: ComF family protein [Candidatus Omnitrophica bacterium]|nr:ComF family protein [Candidatus Omnitrophota bacterium]